MNFQPVDNILITSSDHTPNTIQCISKSSFDDAFVALTTTQQQWVTNQDFKGKSNTLIRIPGDSSDAIWLGVGEADSVSIRNASAWASQQLPAGLYKYDDDFCQFEQAYGWALGQYEFDRYLEKKHVPNRLVISDEAMNELGNIINGLFLTRDLINTPTNDMGPEQLAEVAKELAIEYGANFSQVLDEELLDKGYRTIYAVGMAAENRPRLIELTWGNEDAPAVTLVGKGVCFDSGGLDIKPASSMRIMKKDMGGGAHTLGLASMIMANNLNVNLRVLVPAVENSISDNAFRPGDIIKTYKGTTVEIDNTDAEGRLILCDALALACEQPPELLIDFATLTGAARVAMGPDVVPYFTDDKKLAAELYQHSEKCHDPMWPMPLYKGYEKDLKSPVADMSNMGKGPFGGAITAGLFLKHFVDESVSWVHFDLYGWNSSKKPTCPEGGQSMAIHGVYNLLSDRYK